MQTFEVKLSISQCQNLASFRRCMHIFFLMNNSLDVSLVFKFTLKLWVYIAEVEAVVAESRFLFFYVLLCLDYIIYNNIGRNNGKSHEQSFLTQEPVENQQNINDWCVCDALANMVALCAVIFLFYVHFFVH